MSSQNHFALRIRNAQIVTVCANGEKHKAGKAQGEVSIIENGTIVVNLNGKIEAVGPSAELQARFESAKFDTDIDGTGKSIVPGLVDTHTHPVWSGDRVHEFAMKLAGATYMDIHKMGGGIGFTVQHTKNSSIEELSKLLQSRLDRMIKQGTTVVEAKSGYGLETETEMKMLQVIHQVGQKNADKIEVLGTYLAHSIPKGSNVDAATEDVLKHQIPALIDLKKKGEISPEFIDVFCEQGVFELDHTRRILQAGVDAGLEINFHGDELHPIKAAELAGDMGALAISHLEMISDDGIAALAKRPTYALLLPTTAYVLKLKPPPARKLIEKNVPVVLASDYNPNAHCLSLPAVMNLGCVLMGMTMNEALVATTINAAASVNRSATCGSLEVDKNGDIVLIDAAKWEHLVYEMSDPPIEQVFKKGRSVYHRA